MRYLILTLLIACAAFCAHREEIKTENTSSSNPSCSTPTRITAIYKEYVYDLSGYEGLANSTAYNLFDESQYVDPKGGTTVPRTSPHPSRGAAIFFKDKGSRIVVDLRVAYQLSEIYIYDRSSEQDSVWIYTGRLDNQKLQVGFVTKGSPGLWGWRRFSITDSTRYVTFRFSSPEANVTEAVMYGCALGPEPAKPALKYSGPRLPPKTIKEFLGVNSYHGTPLQWMEPFYYSRVYTNIASIDMDTASDYPNNRYNIVPHGWYNNGINDYVLYVDSIKNFHRGRVWYSYLGVPVPLVKKGFDNHDRPVTKAGMDTEDPMSYARHANMMWTMAAAYGSTRVDTNRMKTFSFVGPRFSGRNVMSIYENGNEPDAYWVGNKYCNPIEYFALSSADYDGHHGKMGPMHGIVNADPNSQLMMAGLATLQHNRVRILDFLCRTMRADSQFLWKGGIQYHYYSTNGRGELPGEVWSSASGGITPEEDSLRQKLTRVREETYKIQPNVECFLGEYGFDKSKASKVSAPLVPGHSRAQSQGIMLTRAINAIAFSGFDRFIIYWIKDVEDENSSGIFLTSGILREYPGQIYKPYPAWFYINTLVHHLGNYVPEKVVQESGNTWIYKYRNKMSSDSTAYFVYAPTRRGQKINNYTLSVDKAIGQAKVVSFLDQAPTGTVALAPVRGAKVVLNVTEVPTLVLLRERR